ncbi:MAG: protein kinase [Pirellulales bacterium]
MIGINTIAWVILGQVFDMVCFESDTCLAREDLKAYLAGWGDPKQIDAIETHIANCSACEKTACDIEREPDSLAGLIALASSAHPDEVSTLSVALGKAQALFTRENQIDTPAELASIYLPQTKIGPYELIKPLGFGGMGSVFLAKHGSLGKHVAIKLLQLRFFRREQFEARFQREIRAAGELNHPAIVSATDAGHDQGIHYLVMEHIDGMDLSRLAKNLGPLSIADACEMIRQAALGLAYAHDLGIVHRDIKPSNLMLHRNGQVKIMDFGLARLGPWSELSTELTTVGQLMGTIDYMAPEQAERADAVDSRADLYSLGATLFRLLCCRAPLADSENQSPLAKLRLLATSEPPKITKLRPDVPQSLSNLIGQLLSRDPQRRPANATLVAEKLVPLARGHNLKSAIEEAFQREVQPRDNNTPDSNQSVLSSQLTQSSGEGHNSVITPGNSVEVDAKTEAFKPALPFTNRSSWTRLAFALSLMLVMGAVAYGGITLWIDGQKGWLRIESESPITVELVAENNSVTSWKIAPGSNTTRVYAGRYRLQIGAGSDTVRVDNEELEVLKGDVSIAKITKLPIEAGPVAADTDVAANSRINSNQKISVQPNSNLPASNSELQPGDCLKITSQRDFKFKFDFVVNADSTVRLPLVGVVSVKGKDVAALESHVNVLYQKYYKESSFEVFREIRADYPKVIPPSSTAILVPGDALWLRSETDDSISHHFKVQADNTVKLPLVGLVSTQGLTIETLVAKLETLYSQFLTEPKIEVFHDLAFMRANATSFAIPNSSRNKEPGDLPTTTADQVVQGKSISEWLKIVATEKDENRVNLAMSALTEAVSEPARRYIAEQLKQLLPNLDSSNDSSNVYFGAFETLLRADRQNYFEYLRQQLDQSSNEAWKRIILECGLPKDADWSEISQIHPWIEANIFRLDHVLLPSIASYYLNRANSDEAIRNPEVAQSWLRPVMECKHLDAGVWLSSAVFAEKPSGNITYWTEVTRRAIEILNDSDATPQNVCFASVVLLRIPLTFTSKLIQPQSSALEKAWQLRAKQLATDLDFRRFLFDSRFEQNWSDHLSKQNQIDGLSFRLGWNRRGVELGFLTAKALSPYAATPRELTDSLTVPTARFLSAYFDCFDPWFIEIQGSQKTKGALATYGRRNQFRFDESYTQEQYERDEMDCRLLLVSHALIDSDRKVLTSVGQQVHEQWKRSWVMRQFETVAVDGSDIDATNYSKLPRMVTFPFDSDPLKAILAIDLNSDHKISVDEYIIARNKLPVSNAFRKGVRLLSQYDLNNDGALSVEEQRRLQVPPPIQADTNSDGFIDPEELGNWMGSFASPR